MIYLRRTVYYRIASLYIYNSLMVVNLTDSLILLFYFFSSSSYFWRFLMAIFTVIVYGFLNFIYFDDIGLGRIFEGSSSIIFCSRIISFSRFMFLVLSFMFSLVKWLLFSMSKGVYVLRANCRAASLIFKGSYWCWLVCLQGAGFWSSSVSLDRLEFTFLCLVMGVESCACRAYSEIGMGFTMLF